MQKSDMSKVARAFSLLRGIFSPEYLKSEASKEYSKKRGMVGKKYAMGGAMKKTKAMAKGGAMKKTKAMAKGGAMKKTKAMAKGGAMKRK
jgi:hypothetical protein